MRFIRLWIPAAVSVMTVSCVSENHQTVETIRIHSELVYSSDGHTEQENIFNSLRASQEQLSLFAKSVGMTDREIISEISDPFLALSVEFVSFDTIEPARKIARFYENEFLFEGWLEKRGILFLEMTNGGDWLRVYKKGDSQVLVHIVGPWDDNFDEIKQGVFTGRTVIFKFYQCTSDDVFGKDNLEKVKTLSLYGGIRDDPCNRQTRSRYKQVVSQLKKTTNGTTWNRCTNWTGEAEAERMDETKK